MNRFLLIFALSLIYPIAASGQDSMVEGIEISGVSDERFSAALKDDLDRLIGRPFAIEEADQLADRIQMELPEYVVAARTAAGSETGKVRVIFVAARISDDGGLGANINSRYPVDAVEIEGVPQSTVSAGLYADMQKMVGERLDNDVAEKLKERLASELGPAYNVHRRVRRSLTQRQLTIIYEVFRIPWLPTQEPGSFVSYHSQQGFSFAVNAGPSLDRRTQKIAIGAANDGDSLIERFAGFRVAYENVRLGTDRLGLNLNYASYRNQWQVLTLNAAAASPGSADIYRRRRNLQASVAFAFDSHLYVTTGINATELEMLEPTVHFEPSRAGVASVRFRRNFDGDNRKQQVRAGYEVHAASHTLDSHFIYTRHIWEGEYLFQRGEQMVSISGGAGKITGNAPMFERFALGDTQTLRGWNKFDLWPLGGSRFANGSFVYHFNDVQVFYDVGSVWDAGQAIKIKPSIGLGFGDDKEGKGFIGIAIPIRDSGMRAVFLVSFRFNAD